MDKAGQRFHALLLEHSTAADPADRKRLEAQLWHEFGQQRAVLVLDMSGFSALSQRHGIVHYLSMVTRMPTRPRRTSSTSASPAASTTATSW